jgi:hypothetical protein
MSTIDEIRQRAEDDLEFKFCHGCQENKSVVDFHKNRSRKDGLATQCRACVSKHSRNHYVKNKSQVYDRYVKRREKHKADYLASQKRWRDANRHITAYHNQVYRDRKRAASFTLTPEQAQEVKDMYWLARDVSITTGEPYEVDHIVPLKGANICGLHVPWNLQVIPKYLNVRKGNSYESH